MLRVMCLLLSISVFSVDGYASPNEKTNNQNMHYHPVAPMLIGAGLMTWGAYELGSDAAEGRRNIAILWGGALVASVGIVLYQDYSDRIATLSLRPTKDKAPALVFNYDF